MKKSTCAGKQLFDSSIWLWSVALVGMVSVGVPRAAAQVTTTSRGNGIAATGAGVVELEPQRLRLNMWVQAQGTDAKSAVKSLAAHKERVEQALAAMNADPESIRFSATRLSTGSDQPEEMQPALRMMRSQLGGPAIDLEQVPSVYTAKAALQAEWPLPTTDRDALAILPQGLLDQIKNRDLAGEENKPELSEEEQERFDEMQAMMEENFGGYPFGAETDAGPNVVFVAAVDRQQRLDATKQAFQRAEESAGLIAAAAAMKLGPLQSVMATQTNISNMRTVQYPWSNNAEEDPFDNAQEEVVTAPSPDTLRYSVSLTAAYGL